MDTEATLRCRCWIGKYLRYFGWDAQVWLTRDAFCRYHNPEASLEEGIEILKRCIDEVNKRLIVGLGKFKVRVCDKDGIREIEL